MATALTALLWLIGALIALIGLILATPLSLELVLRKDARWDVSAAVRIIGSLGPRIALKKRQAHKEKPKRRKKKRRTGVPGGSPVRFASAAMRLLGDILGAVRVRSGRVDARVGLGDPAETGQLMGLIAPLVYGTSGMRAISLNIEPVFDDTVLAGDARLDLSLRPVSLLAPFIRFGWRIFGPAK